MIGLHGPIKGDIFYLNPEEAGHIVPLAIRIVFSRGYENGDVIIYGGQGGKD